MSLLREIHQVMVELYRRSEKDREAYMENLGRRYDQEGQLVCYYCGRPICEQHKRSDEDYDVLSLETDHVLPRSRGGANASWNLVEACFLCNGSKSDEWLTNWLVKTKCIDEIPDEVAKDLIARLLLVAFAEVYRR